MPKILIVSATYHEVKFLEKLNLKLIDEHLNRFQFQFQDTQIEVLITGVGMIATTFLLTKHLSKNSYDVILNIGIAGAFEKTFQLGDVVEITSDCFAELGADDGDHFISIFNLGLMDKDEFPFNNGLLKNNIKLNSLDEFKKVNGITVNKVNGNTETIERLKNQLSTLGYKPEVESMEGAAFFYSCFQFKMNGIQLRAISNYIEKRNRASWKIGDALVNLEKATLLILPELISRKW